MPAPPSDMARSRLHEKSASRDRTYVRPIGYTGIMTRPIEDYDEAMRLLAMGVSQAQTARRTGIPRSTIRTWITAGPKSNEARRRSSSAPCAPCPHIAPVSGLPEYAYLLGLYLGDGCISAHKRGVYALRIALDQKYPGIIRECDAAMRTVLPNRVSIVARPGCVEVVSNSKHWPCLFPQHGPGPKHLRPIVLEPWQHGAALVDHPQLLLRGLIHSDGWRGMNVAVTPHGRYYYPRYQFCNRSDDIRGIFTEACVQLGVDCRQTNRWNLAVSRRADVAKLDSFIGPKS